MRNCPSCGVSYRARVRKDHCRSCGVRIYHGKHDGKPLTIAYEEKEAVDTLMAILREFILDRDGVDIMADYQHTAKERHFLYSLVERARLFLSRQMDSLGWTAATFVVDLIKYVLSLEWWRDNIRSFLMLTNKVGELAARLYKQRRDEVMTERWDMSTFVEDKSLLEGEYA